MKISIKFLNELMVKNNIPETATLQADTEFWECGEVDCHSVYYNPKQNTIILHGENNGLYHREGCIQLFSDNNHKESFYLAFRYYVNEDTKEVCVERQRYEEWER